MFGPSIARILTDDRLWAPPPPKRRPPRPPRRRPRLALMRALATVRGAAHLRRRPA